MLLSLVADVQVCARWWIAEDRPLHGSQVRAGIAAGSSCKKKWSGGRLLARPIIGGHLGGCVVPENVRFRRKGQPFRQRGSTELRASPTASSHARSGATEADAAVFEVGHLTLTSMAIVHEVACERDVGLLQRRPKPSAAIGHDGPQVACRATCRGRYSLCALRTSHDRTCRPRSCGCRTRHSRWMPPGTSCFAPLRHGASARRCASSRPECGVPRIFRR